MVRKVDLSCVLVQHTLQLIAGLSFSCFGQDQPTTGKKRGVEDHGSGDSRMPSLHPTSSLSSGVEAFARYRWPARN